MFHAFARARALIYGQRSVRGKNRAYLDQPSFQILIPCASCTPTSLDGYKRTATYFPSLNCVNTRGAPNMSPETALDVDPVWLRRFINRHGGAQTYTDNDMTPLTLFILSSCILIALTPPTRGWKIVRASLLPLLVIYQAHFSIFTLAPKWETQWGNITGQLWHLEKALEVMWFYPGEEHCYRVRRRADMVQDKGDKAMKGEEKGDELLPETIPPPRTLAKLYWSLNLWFSERGIGWNYAAPLPDSSRRHPFTRTSGRIPFLFNRGMYLTIVYLVSDLARSYMACKPLSHPA